MASMREEDGGRRATPATRLVPWAIAVIVASAGCGTADDPSGPVGPWSGAVSSEGDLTTVVTESGSVWEGEGRLVEEASIGVEEGDDAYMLGDVQGVAIAGDEILVLDRQAHALRRYDLDGRHLGDLGQEGQGPGEFVRPDGLGVSPDGRLFVRDYSAGRLTVFDPGGDTTGESWPLATGFFSAQEMVVTRGGVPHVPDLLDRGASVSEWKLGMRPYGPEGPSGDPVPAPEFDFEEVQLEARGDAGMMATGIPYYPRIVWTMAPSGAMVAGVSNAYRIEVRRQRPGDGDLAIEKRWEPTPLSPDEREWHRRQTIAQMRRRAPDWVWEGPPVPDHKPAFERLFVDHDERIWVVREGPSERVADCDEDPLALDPSQGRTPRPCWRSSNLLDVFAPDGRFLGTVHPPDGMRFRPAPYISGETFLGVVIDEAGTLRVKRYRLQLPDGEVAPTTPSAVEVPAASR